MKENSRIRFNPVTKEIEVEGSEAFVKTHFLKLQRLLLQVPEEKKAKQTQRKARPVAKAKKTRPGRKGAKETQADTVISLVSGSAGGITTTALKDKTGLTERQIWSIVYRAQKQGKIRKTKRGLYTAA